VRNIRRIRGGLVTPRPRARRHLRFEEVNFFIRDLRLDLPQGRHIVEYPERPPVGCDYDIVAMNRNVTFGNGW